MPVGWALAPYRATYHLGNCQETGAGSLISLTQLERAAPGIGLSPQPPLSLRHLETPSPRSTLSSTEIQRPLPTIHIQIMSDFSGQPWSDNPNAPNITHSVYFAEKANFAGMLISSILYGEREMLPPTCPSIGAYFFVRFTLGVLIVLFFQCIATLFKPVHDGRVKWGLISYTAVMFLFVTVYMAMNLNLQSISFIDNREFFGGIYGTPGPIGYQSYVQTDVSGIVANVMFLSNYWLADGLLVRSLSDVASTRPGI